MRHRRGVTLIELLVVIAIITALSTLIVAVAPRFGERQRATRGAGQLQSWLNLAKQRALRDQRPVGLRLLPPTTGLPYVTDLQYVEVPDEYIGGTVTVPHPDPTIPPVDKYKYVQLTIPVWFNPKAADALLLPGDVLMIPGPGYAPRRIVSVGLPSPPTPSSPPPYTYAVKLDQPLTPTQSQTGAHRVYRKARPVVGETVLQLPKDIAIDITQEKPTSAAAWYRLYPPANTGTDPFDILFARPDKWSDFSNYSRICLWVRDVSLNTTGPNVRNNPNLTDPTALPPGENTLITIYTRTGHVTAHPVDPAGLVPNSSTSITWNPFKFTQDGLSSGQ